MSKYWNANAFLNLPYTIILKFFLIKKKFSYQLIIKYI